MWPASAPAGCNTNDPCESVRVLDSSSMPFSNRSRITLSPAAGLFVVRFRTLPVIASAENAERAFRQTRRKKRKDLLLIPGQIFMETLPSGTARPPRPRFHVQIENRGVPASLYPSLGCHA